MKKTIILLQVFLLLVFFTNLRAQKTDRSSSQPFKYLYDQSGKKYELKDLLISSPRIHEARGDSAVTIGPAPGKGYSTNQTNSLPLPTLTCSAGYFNLYFDNFGLFAQAAARDIACQVYTDISNFITAASPLNTAAGVGPKINIYCSYLIGGGSLLGAATTFFAFPNNPTNSNQGVTDGLVYQYLTTGVDPLTMIPSTYANSSQPNVFFHGYVVMKDIGPTWNIPLTSLPSGIQIDLYTVMLHEVMHSLGFLSLMDQNGMSWFGAANNYYNRYDKFLTDAAGTPLLNNSMNPGCTGSNLQYAGLPTDIEPGGGYALCTTNAKFVGGLVDEKVYTPAVFAGGSSLSHFEDACNGHVGGCGSGPGYYFAMAAMANYGTCYVKRYPREEERQAFCTLGYTCSIAYNSSAPGALAASFSYGSFCTPNNIIGMNDGLVNGNYTYNTTGSSINIPMSLLLANDLPNTGLSVSCVEIIYNNTFNNVSFSMVGSNLVVNATAGSGLVILKYYPTNGADMGNATYVYVQFNSANCNSQGNCNLVQNGSYENITGSPSCGELGVNLPATAVNCWAPAEGDPAVFTRLCTSNTTFELGVNTLGASPGVIESFNGSPNNSVIGLNYVYGTSNSEAIKNYLSAPLVPGISYDISFMVMNPLAVSPYNYTGDPVEITVGALPLFNSATSVPYALAGSMEVIAQFIVPAGANWQQVSSSFVFAPFNNTIHQAIVIGINPINTNAMSGSPPPELYCYIDEVSLIQTNGVNFYTGNPTICGTYGIPDLSLFTNYPGTFSGTGVSFAGGLYSFNTGSSPLPPGQYPIAFNYAINGCTYTSYQFITISSNTNLLALTQNVCAPSGVINLTSLVTNPAFITGTTFSVNGVVASSPYTFGSQGTYTITAENPNGLLCNNSAVTEVHFYTVPATPSTFLNGSPASSATICMGDNTNLFVNAMGIASFYQWGPNLPMGSFFNPSPNPTVTTVYTVVAYNNVYCPSSTASFTIVVDPSCCTSTLSPYTGGSNMSGYYNTPFTFTSSIVVPPGNILVLYNAEFQFGPNTALVVSNNATLIVWGAHLYSCGPQMWKGIKLSGGASMVAANWQNTDNLIEDAETAIDVMSATNTFSVLQLYNIIFNKNHVDIRINNYVANQSLYPFEIARCVFTCRDLPYTSTTWPTVHTISGLRSPASVVIPPDNPYKLLYYPLATLKIPFTGEMSSIALDLIDVGLSTGGNYYGINVGAGGSNSFNIFDAHGTFINAENSNVLSTNNVFQNTQRYFSTANNMIEGGTAIVHSVNNLMNTSLEITASGGVNYFYDCHKAVSGTNIYRFFMQGSTLRSNQDLSWGSGYLPGNTGVELSTNRLNYMIADNIFSNIKDCIKIPIGTGLYDMGWGMQSGTYIFECRVLLNYFGAQVSSSIPLTGQFTNLPVDISGVNSGAWTGAGNPIYVYSNRVDRGYRGIRITGLNGFPCEIKSNELLLADEPSTVPQNGIEALNTLGGLAINSNLLSGPNKLNNNMSLVYLDNNITPTVTCNSTRSSYNAFVFNGANTGTWMGNTMKSHARGLTLQNSGVIGPQGNPGSRSDNQWGGSWILPDYETYVINSNAAFSPLYVLPSGFYLPVNNGGVATGNYNGTGNLQTAGGAPYTCTNTGLPSPPQYRVTEETGLVDLGQKNSLLSIYPNPTSGKLSIAGDEESEAIGIVVSDLSGKRIIEKQVRTENSRAEIFLDLENGIYFIELVKETTGEKMVRKLVISK